MGIDFPSVPGSFLDIFHRNPISLQEFSRDKVEKLLQKYFLTQRTSYESQKSSLGRRHWEWEKKDNKIIVCLTITFERKFTQMLFRPEDRKRGGESVALALTLGGAGD
ncbi:hypothetical protein TNIN_499761 [Trichonephila inaurata madagascariensis]|uniref:Uncharacterized protein n=1 Tax=Trichonephila inaurata madagascariensis TaxID=2747483 RepID=A0A8X6X4C1_9ARAC|nr:hypothetical protein TNIN_499761 [Trichonephila inaurata madagascariensis]